MITRKWGAGKSLSALILAGAMCAPAAVLGGNDIPESDESIRLALNEWTGQHITTRIAGETLREMGYNVEYVTAGYVPQLDGIARGNITATLELWEQTIGPSYTQALASGDVVPMGDTGIVTREGFVYPGYMTEICPGLPDYKALNDCTQALATSDTFPKGRIIDYPIEWDPDTSQRVEALGLDLVAQPSGSVGAAVAEMRSAIARERPILVAFWQPHWLFSQYDLQWVDLPESAPECYEDPSWGINPNMTHDCGWPTGWVRKVAWSGMEDKWPAAHRFLQAYQIDNAVQEKLMFAIDVEDASLEEAVADWMSRNEDTWRTWISTALGE